jgi:hypothetical protein
MTPPIMPTFSISTSNSNELKYAEIIAVPPGEDDPRREHGMADELARTDPVLA